jgi:Big-like domain-containing protein
VSVSSAPVNLGTAATVTVKVDASPSAVSGTVELREGDKVRGSASLSNGSATFKLPVGLAAGSHTLTASYSGSDSIEAAQGTGTVTVNPPPAWKSTILYKAEAKVSYNGKTEELPGDPRCSWTLIR